MYDIHRISPEEIQHQKVFAQQVRFHPERPQSYYIVTYGCQMNAHDSEIIAGPMGLAVCGKRLYYADNFLKKVYSIAI